MTDEQAADKRRSPRSKTYAKVLVEGTNNLGYLRDLSPEGCQVALLAPPAAGAEQILRVTILPEPEIGVPRFRMALEVRWSRASPPYFLLGGKLRPLAGDLGHDGARRAMEELLRYYAG